MGEVMEQCFEHLLQFALRRQTTDIHFSRKENTFLVKMRTLKGMVSYPKNNQTKELVAYLKYLAGLDLTTVKPQSGAFSYVYKGKTYFFRLAVIQSLQQESAVLRILNMRYIHAILTENTKQQLYFEQMLQLDNGLILIAGATGSGKTTTLYNMLQKMNQKSIYTVEDPIEIYFDNIMQLQVNMQQGLDYQAAIKQVLRHDPDVIVIGEIRDEVEAHMAIRAALTGHLVMATIHASSAKEVKQRLLDLNINSYDLKATIQFIIYQQLCSTSTERYCHYEIIDNQTFQATLETS